MEKIIKPQIRFDLLQELAEHLLYGDMGHPVFNYEVYNNSPKAVCGTQGCAIGECPIVWPKQWSFGPQGLPILNEIPGNQPYEAGRKFFGLTYLQYDHLFCPGSQKPGRFGGQRMENEATKEEVALHILGFIAFMRENENE